MAELGRLEYLRLLRAGYLAIGNVAHFPEDLRAELIALEAEAAVRERDEREAKRKADQEEFDRRTKPEMDVMEYWQMQRQHGRTRAAELWFEKHGIQPWEITEIEEALTEQDINLEKAKKQQGLRHTPYPPT